jgi:CRP/FNR family transcriptional regulator, cyclic AMP receptor protein
VLNIYGPGEIFGELALLDGEPRSADAVAQESSRVFWLQRADFAAFLDSHPRAAMTMLASLSRRLRHTTRVVQAATCRPGWRGCCWTWRLGTARRWRRVFGSRPD